MRDALKMEVGGWQLAVVRRDQKAPRLKRGNMPPGIGRGGVVSQSLLTSAATIL